MQNIYRETIPTEKSGEFTRQVIYYENGKYTFSCYPIEVIKSACGNFTTEKSLGYSGYKIEIHTCERKSKKQDSIAIEKAKLFYENHK